MYYGDTDQNKIKLRNLMIKEATSPYSGSPYKSYGYVMHWAYVFFGLMVADYMTIKFDSNNESGVLLLSGVEFSRFKFDNELNHIVFYEIKNKYMHSAELQDIYIKALRNNELKNIIF